MMRSQQRVLWMGQIVLWVALLLVACQGGATPVVIQEGAAETQAAATAFYQNRTATAEAALLPTGTPTPTGTPYQRPTDDPSVSPDTVIAHVAGHDITVAEFRNRVRYQRWAALESVRRIIETAGLSAESIRDPNNPLTPTVAGYFYTLANAEQFAERVLELMIQERILHQEFVARELAPLGGLQNNLWARLVGLEPTENGLLPEGFDEAFDAFMENLSWYTDLTEVELRFIIAVASEEETVANVVGKEVEYDPTLLNVRHILVATEEEALEVIRLLEEGADFVTLARERSIAPSANGNGGDLGEFERDDMVAEFAEAAFSAEPGVVVGPVQTQYGYHLILVHDRQDELHVRNILVETEEEAQAVIARLEAGEDFTALAEEVSIDPDVADNGGDLGFIQRGQTPQAFEEAVFGAEVGEIVGPVQTSFGWHVAEVTERRAVRVHASHILVETEAEAESALERLAAGEDFAALANELSIDPSAQGNGGELGFVGAGQLPDALFAALKAAPMGEIVGPIETEVGFSVAQVTDRQVNIVDPQDVEELEGMYFQNWLRDEIEQVEINEVWREVYPSDPQPADIGPILAELEAVFNEVMEAFATPSGSE